MFIQMSIITLVHATFKLQENIVYDNPCGIRFTSMHVCISICFYILTHVQTNIHRIHNH